MSKPHNSGLTCDACGRGVFPLLVTTICDWCDGTSTEPLYRGFVVWRGHHPGRREYVFRTREDAHKWSSANGLDGKPVRRVACENPFCWRASSGSIQDMELADVLYDIYPGRDFWTGAQRAFIDDEVTANA